MTNLDTVLRDSLHRLAQPGDPSGVAQLIHARLDSLPPGDGSQPPSASPSGPAGPGILHSWGFWAGVVAAAAVGGTALGASGAFGSSADATSGVPASIHTGALALGCPGGSPVETLEPGTRILAILQSDDGAYLAVRDPYELSRTVWLPTGIVVIDEGQPGVDTLPIGGCPEPSVGPTEPVPEPSITPEPIITPEPDPEVAPTKPAPPKPAPPTTPPPAPKDTTPPAISAGSFSPSPLHGAATYCLNSFSEVTVTATDEGGIASVTGSTTYPGAVVSPRSRTGSSWVFRFQMPGADPAPAVTSASVSFTATDMSGNPATTSATVAVEYCVY